MPQKIQYSNGNKAEYFYDASGVKYKAQWGYAVNTQNIPLGATGTENNSLTGVTRTEYCGNYVYEQGILRRIITPEGFVSTSNDVSTTGIKYTWRYNYFLKDHLGNTRRTLRSNTLSSISTALSAFSEIIDYYPFGMEVTEVYNPNGEDYSMSYLAGSSTPNLYNGKEIDRMHGLNMYDYGARWKDLNWLTIDPLAEKHYDISPYAYCANNPIRFIDPDGRELVISGILSEDAMKQLQSKVGNGMTISMNESGQVSYSVAEGVELSEEAQRIATIIDNKSIIVNLETTDISDGSMLGGAFMGNQVIIGADDKVFVITNQVVNPNITGEIDGFMETPGKSMMHEVTESYEGALISQESRTSANPARRNETNEIYNTAHNRATKENPITYRLYDQYGNKLRDNQISDAVRVEYFITNNGKTKIIQTINK